MSNFAVNSHDPSVVTSQSVASLLAGATGAGGHGGSVGDIGSVVGTGGPLGINDLQRQQQQQRGIQTYPDGTVTNIPQSMVTDQFGMIGLLTFIRAAETDQHLVSLALGADLTSLGLNLNQVCQRRQETISNWYSACDFKIMKSRRLKHDCIN